MNIKLKYPQKFKKQHKKRLTRRINNLISDGYSSMRTHRTYALYPQQNIILPKRFISYIRKMLRKLFKKRRIHCWFRLQPNKVISSKSKNSRMGKGVGTINRSAFKVTAGKPILILTNISQLRLTYLTKSLQSRLPVRLVTKYYK